MTTQQFLTSRRKALLDFFSWRFGTKYWTGPASYCTGVSKSLFARLRSREEILWPYEKPRWNAVTIRDIYIAEQAALHLGFKPARYSYLDRYSLLKPPPLNLPKWSDPEVVKRFKAWQMKTPGERDKLERTLAVRRQRRAERKTERKAVADEGVPEVGKICPLLEGLGGQNAVGKSCPAPPEETQS